MRTIHCKLFFCCLLMAMLPFATHSLMARKFIIQKNDGIPVQLDPVITVPEGALLALLLITPFGRSILSIQFLLGVWTIITALYLFPSFLLPETTFLAPLTRVMAQSIFR